MFCFGSKGGGGGCFLQYVGVFLYDRGDIRMMRVCVCVVLCAAYHESMVHKTNQI
jgi:hypothetical protein